MDLQLMSEKEISVAEKARRAKKMKSSGKKQFADVLFFDSRDKGETIKSRNSAYQLLTDYFHRNNKSENDERLQNTVK